METSKRPLSNLNFLTSFGFSKDKKFRDPYLLSLNPESIKKKFEFLLSLRIPKQQILQNPFFVFKKPRILKEKIRISF